MRIFKIIATTAIAALPLLAAARPATPELLRHVNPDGSVVEFRLHGNEKFSFMTDAENVNILEIDKTGRMVPTMRDGVALKAVDADIQRLMDECPLTEMMPARKISRMAMLEDSGADKGRTTFPSVGEVRSCVILLEYPDIPFSTAKDGNVNELFNRLCNEEGFSEYGSRGSARDYYKAVSNGKFSPQFDVYGPVKLKHPARWYANVDEDDPILEGHKASDVAKLLDKKQNKQPRFGYAIAEAMEALDGEVDFSKYDYDNNKEIDNIFFFYSGPGAADTGDGTYVWPHQSDFRGYTDDYFLGTFFNLPRQIYDGVELTCYATSCEINSSSRIPEENQPWLDGIGAFCHEFGHVLGLPDLYDVSGYGIKTPKDYSVMDSGSYNMLSTCPPMFSAYEQWLCKWIEYTNAEDGTKYELNPLTDDDRNCVRLRIRQPGGVVSYYPEYYVIETRSKTGWDESLAEHGMLIWRVNYSRNIWMANEVNSYGRYNTKGTPHVELIAAPNAPRNSYTWPDDYNGVNFIYPDMNVFAPESSRNPLNVYITNMEYDSETGKASFEYNMCAPSEEVTVMHDNPYVSVSKREIYLHWDKVPGMKYMVSVKRTDPSGAQKVVDDLDDAIVEENRCTVRNITKNQWSQTFTAKVRVYNGVPGKNYSNTITFIPAEMQEGDENSSVGSVGAEVPFICGGQGCIVAPAGSKVYNMSGVECGMSDLPAGVYIVVAPGATAKVYVH